MEARASDVESTERPDKVPIFWRQSQGGKKNAERILEPGLVTVRPWKRVLLTSSRRKDLTKFPFFGDKVKGVEKMEGHLTPRLLTF